MRIEIIDQALANCEEYIQNSSSADEELKNMLTQALLILMCAEFEKKFKEFILERCSEIDDDSIKEYIINKTRIRSLKISDISGLTGEFGEKHKSEFKRLIDGSSTPCDVLYESVRSNRNKVAHGEGCNATILDVKQYYEGAHEVLDHFKQALWVDE